MDDITSDFIDKTPKNPKDSLRRKYLLRKRNIPRFLSEFIWFSESVLKENVYVNKNKVREIKRLIKKSKELLALLPKEKELPENELDSHSSENFEENYLSDMQAMLKQMHKDADEVFKHLLKLEKKNGFG
jgi:hypothetical protein